MLEFSEVTELRQIIEARTWSGYVAGSITLLQTPYGFYLDKIVLAPEYTQEYVLDALMQRLIALHDDKLIRLNPFSLVCIDLPVLDDIFGTVEYFCKYGFTATQNTTTLQKPAKSS